MRIIIVLIIVFALDLYAYQALKAASIDWMLPWKAGLRFGYWLISIALIVVLFLAFRFNILEKAPKIFTISFMGLFMMILVGKLVTSIFLTIDDLRRIGNFVFSKFNSEYTYNPGRSKFLSQLSLIMGALPILILGNGILRNAFRYKKHYIDVTIQDLPEDLDGLKIVQISDIHSGTYLRDKPIYRAIEMINEEDPDLVFFTGDLVNEKTSEVDDYIHIFKQIKAKNGVFSVLGNHDYGDYYRWDSMKERNENLEDMHRAHHALGWDLLLNENRVLKIGEANLNIIGVENISGNKRFHSYGDLHKAVEGVNLDDTSLLLSHDPTHWDLEVNSDFKNIDVTFSGHTHGMQFGIEIPGVLKWSPAKYFYPQWAGLYQNKKQYLYVNRGFGTLGYPGRVGILPEITIVKLTKA